MARMALVEPSLSTVDCHKFNVFINPTHIEISSREIPVVTVRGLSMFISFRSITLS